MPYATVDRCRLYYEAHGAGIPLVCVMGLGDDVSSWRAQVPAFSRRYRTVVFDNRDAGRSSCAEEPYSVADMAADTIALADALELERFHLLGVSLGGAIAQDVALALGDRVLTLTLCMTYAGYGRWARDLIRLQVRDLQSKSEDELLEQMLLLSVSEATYEAVDDIVAVREALLSHPHRQRRDAFIRQLEASALHDARERLGALSMPIHVIGAERDLLVPAWRARELAELIPGARLSIMPAAAHRAYSESSRNFNALVLDFLEAAEATPAAAAAGSGRR